MADIVMIPIENLNPHPYNPRKDLGDLSELAESIRANGVLQNLTVVPMELVDPDATVTLGNGHYTIVIGHRRHAAAKLAGLTELPCVIVEMDAREQMQTMLIENMQRSDLTVFEQAQGFQMMLDLGATVEEIAEKSGFSVSTVRRRVKMMELDQKKLKEVSSRQLTLGDFDTLAQIEDIKERNACLEKIGTNDFNMAVQKALKLQNINANMPKAKAWLKQVKAKQIKDGDRWSSKYDRVGSSIYIEKWGEDGNKPRPDAESKPLFYYLGKKEAYDYGQLQLYHEHEKAPPVKRSPEEIAKDKAVKAAWDKLDSLCKNAHSLRKKFIADFTVTKKNEQQVIFGAVLSACYNEISYNTSDKSTLYKLAGITDSGYIPEREEKFFEGFDKISGDDWAKLVYALFGDADIGCYSGYRKEFPRFEHNRKLELIYRWLSSLGYKMSTEEAQLISGDHEAYQAAAVFEGESS